MSRISCKADIGDNLILNIDRGMYGLEDKNGNTLVVPMYKYISPPYCGIHFVESSEGYFGYIKSNGSDVVPAIFDIVEYIEHGLIKVCDDGKWGVYSTNGEELVSPEFDVIEIKDHNTVYCGYHGSEVMAELVLK